MAQFNYTDIKKGKIVIPGDTLMLYHKEHVVKQDTQGYFLECVTACNDWIFEHLNIKDKYKFCGCLSERGIFPYMKTLSELTRVIKKLWEYNPICKGDKIKVRNIESSDEYGIYVTDTMTKSSGKYIESREQYFDEYDQNIKCGVYTGIFALGYYWSADILDFSTVQKASIDFSAIEKASIYEEDTIERPVKPSKFKPVSMKMDYPLTQEECVGATGLILPRKNKNLKITL